MWTGARNRCMPVDRSGAALGVRAFSSFPDSQVNLDITITGAQGRMRDACTDGARRDSLLAGNPWRWGITDEWPLAARGLITFVLLLSVPPAGEVQL